MELTFATLMARAQDEPDAMYGLAARAVRISADGLTYRFLLRPEATFHDGTPLTAHDVAFSLKIAEGEGASDHQQLLRDFTGAEATTTRTVVVRFAREARARRAAVRRRPADFLARLLLRHARSRRRRSTCRSVRGAYKVGRFEPGRFIEYERVKDWWGADLPVAARPEQFRRRAL